MRKQVVIAFLLMLVFAGMGSSALVARSYAGSQPLTLIQREKKLGPKPTPHWYWRWAEWRLGEGYAKNHRLERSLRPKRAPYRIPRWGWRRLRFFLLARTLADEHHGSQSGGGETYDQAIAYTQTRPVFIPTRTILVSNASQLQSAIANLQAGDLVKATASFTVSGETIIQSRLSAPAVIDLSGYAVKFIYSGGQDYPAVWINNAQNIQIYGGDASTADTGGACILDHGSQHVLWWGFTAHDCGGSGFEALTVSGPVDHNDFQGTIWKVGQNLAWDPHADKGTGEHCAGEFADANTNYDFTNNRLAFYCHDISTGAAFAFGNDQAMSMSGNTLYLKAQNLTCVATTQTCGNAIELWGDTDTMGLDIKYVEVDNATNSALFAGGVYSGQNLNGVTVEYGRTSNIQTDPYPTGHPIWDTSHGITYQNARVMS